MGIRAKVLAAGLLMCGLSSNAFAVVCTSTSSWGSLSAPDSESFSRSRTSTGTYTDCYTFSISAAANAFGGLIESDPEFNRLNIDVLGISLFAGGISNNRTSNTSFADQNSSLMDFNFGTLNAGTYSLAIVSTISRFTLGSWLRDLSLSNESVRYGGTIQTRRVGAPTSVPEPSGLALLGLGLAAVGLAVRRRKNHIQK